MKSDKLRLNILVSFSLLSRNVWLSVQWCSFLPPQSMESSTEEKEARRKHNAWNAIRAINLLFWCRQGSNLVFFCLVLDCHESCFSTEISIFSEDGSLICISNFILLNEKHAYSMCKCWCSLGLSPHLQDPETGYEGWPSTSSHLFFLKHDWNQLHCQRSRLYKG